MGWIRDPETYPWTLMAHESKSTGSGSVTLAEHFSVVPFS